MRYATPLDYTRSGSGLTEALNRAEDRALWEGGDCFVLYQSGEGYLLVNEEELEEHPGLQILAGYQDGERCRWAAW